MHAMTFGVPKVQFDGRRVNDCLDWNRSDLARDERTTMECRLDIIRVEPDLVVNFVHRPDGQRTT